MNIKESFSRLVAWAKEHPYIAALILAAVGFLAWWTIKQGGGSGGSGGDGLAAADPSGDGGAAVTSDLGIGQGDTGGFSGEGVTLPDLAPVADYGFSQNSNGFSDFGYIPPIDAGIPVGFSDPGIYAGVPISSAPLASMGVSGYSVGGGLAQSASNPAADILAGVSGYSAGGKLALAGGGASGGLNATAGGGVASQSPASSTAGVGGGQNIDTHDRSPAPVSNPTPAMLVGKGRHFTGTFQGIRYVDGYPVTGNSPTVVYNNSQGQQVTSSAVTVSGGGTAVSHGLSRN